MAKLVFTIQDTDDGRVRYDIDQEPIDSQPTGAIQVGLQIKGYIDAIFGVGKPQEASEVEVVEE